MTLKFLAFAFQLHVLMRKKVTFLSKDLVVNLEFLAFAFQLLVLECENLAFTQQSLVFLNQSLFLCAKEHGSCLQVTYPPSGDPYV